MLRGRVGRILLTTDGGACDVTIDDQPAGTTPLDGPLLVSVGPRKIALACTNDRALMKRIEVTAGETVRVDLKVPPAPIAAVRAAMNGGPSQGRDGAERRARTSSPAGSSPACSWPRSWPWGRPRSSSSRSSASMRNSFPANSADLDRQSSLTTGLAISSDVLGAATLAAAGVATYLTIKYERGKHVNVGLTARGVSVGGTF